MGYAMYRLSARVRISRDHFCEVLAAIKSLQGSETCGQQSEKHFMWIDDSAEFLSTATLDEVLKTWRWPILDTDEAGNIEELNFSGENYGNEDLLFAAISPFVMPGSEIVMAGEDGVLWRWYFSDQTVRKEFGRLVFDQQARDLLLADGFLGDWPHKID